MHLLMKAMLVSLGVPTYNCGHYLPQALDSLLAQDHRDIEIIISDNGSTDATAEICAEYQRRDARIRYVRSEQNHGALWNFRRVLDLSRGDFFAWHGDDDLRSPNFVSATLKRLQSSGAVLCTTNISAIDLAGDLHPFEMGPPLQGQTPGESIASLSRSRYWADIYGLMRKDALREIELRDTWGWDVIFTLELALRGAVVCEPAAETFIRFNPRKTTGNVAERTSIRVSWRGMVRELVAAVCRSPLPLHEKAKLSTALLRRMLGNDMVRYGLKQESRAFSQAQRVARRMRRAVKSIGLGA